MSRRTDRVLELLKDGKQVYWVTGSVRETHDEMTRMAKILVEMSISVVVPLRRIRLENGGELIFVWRPEQLRGIRPAAIVGVGDPFFRAIGVELIP